MTINGINIDKSKLLRFIDNNQKIQAIKFIKDHTNLNLKACKDIVDNLEHNPYHYANDAIDVSANIDFTEVDYEKNSSGKKRGSHFIKTDKSNIKNYIIVALAIVIAILGYLMIVK